jgi:hypothetical protein
VGLGAVPVGGSGGGLSQPEGGNGGRLRRVVREQGANCDRLFVDETGVTPDSPRGAVVAGALYS